MIRLIILKNDLDASDRLILLIILGSLLMRKNLSKLKIEKKFKFGNMLKGRTAMRSI